MERKKIREKEQILPLPVRESTRRLLLALLRRGPSTGVSSWRKLAEHATPQRRKCTTRCDADKYNNDPEDVRILANHVVAVARKERLKSDGGQRCEHRRFVFIVSPIAVFNLVSN